MYSIFGFSDSQRYFSLSNLNPPMKVEDLSKTVHYYQVSLMNLLMLM